MRETRQLLLVLIAVLAIETRMFRTATAQNSNGLCYGDITFVLDDSGSIRDNDPPGVDSFQLELDFVKSIVKTFEIGPDATRVAVVSFGNLAHLEFNLTAYTTQSDILAAVDRIQYRQENTNLTGGFKVARTQVFGPTINDRPQVDHVIVLISDGVPTYDADKLDSEVAAVKAMGIRIVALGVTKLVNETLLRSIVSQPSNSSYVYADSFDTLTFVKNMLIMKTCNISPAPDPVPPPECAGDILFVLDDSGSIRDNDPPGVDSWKMMLSFLKSIVQSTFNIGIDSTRVGVVTFGNVGNLEFGLSTYTTQSDILAAVDRIPYRQENTNMTGGLWVARQQFQAAISQRPTAVRTVVLISDGEPTRDTDKLQSAVDALKAMGIRIVGLGVTKLVNETLMRSIVTQPASSNYVYATGYESLALIKNLLVNKTCNVEPAPDPGLPTNPDCNNMDVTFLIDDSGSIRDNDRPGTDSWQLVLNFVSDVVRAFDVAPTAVRVAAVTFGNFAKLEFNLNTYSTQSDVIAAVNRIAYFQDNTNMTGGFKVTRQQVIDLSLLDRPNAKRVIVLISDGVPTRDVDQLDAVVGGIKGMGVRIVGVGVTNLVNETLLRSIVTQPADDNYVYSARYGSLNFIKDLLVLKTCNSTLQEPTPPGCELWIRRDNTMSAGGSYSNANGESNCKSACLRTPYCVAADVATGVCLLHNTTDDLLPRNTFSEATCSTQFILNTACLLTTTATTPHIGCDLWIRTEGTMSAGGFYSNATASSSDCMYACLRTANCVAVDVAAGVCLLHNATDDLLPRNTFKRADCSTQYRLNPTCWSTVTVSPTTTFTTFSSFSTTTFPTTTTTTTTTQSCDPLPDTYDVALLLDISNVTTLNATVELAREVISRFKVGQNESRVALVTYAGSAVVDFYLDDYDNKSAVLRALGFKPRPTNGQSNTQDALRQAYQNVFSDTHGDRSDVPNIALLITGTKSTSSQYWTIPVSDVTKLLDIEIFVVTVGQQQADLKMAKALASSPPDRHAFELSSAQDVKQTADRIAAQLCR